MLCFTTNLTFFHTKQNQFFTWNQILPKFIVENVYFQHLLGSDSHKEPTFYVLGERGELCFLLRSECTHRIYIHGKCTYIVLILQCTKIITLSDKWVDRETKYYSWPFQTGLTRTSMRTPCLLSFALHKSKVPGYFTQCVGV